MGFTNVFGKLVNGRVAIENYQPPIFKTMFNDNRLTATQTRIIFQRGCVPSGGWKMRRAEALNR